MIFTQKIALQTPSKVYFDNLIIKVLPDFIGLRDGQRPGKDLPNANKRAAPISAALPSVSVNRITSPEGALKSFRR